MGPEAANQKRKRGRPTNASRDNGSASQSQLTLTTNGLTAGLQTDGDGDGEHEARPKKRGRPAKAVAPTHPAPEQEASEIGEPPQKKKRGRPSLIQKPLPVNEPEVEEAPVGEANRRKRGRPAAPPKEAPDEVEEDSNAAAKNKPPKKRGRPSLNHSREEPREDRPEEVAPTRKRGRPPRQAEAVKDKVEAAEEADDENEGNSSLLRRSGRESHKTREWYKGSPSKNHKQPEKENEPVEEDAEDPSHGEESTATVRPKKAKKKGRPAHGNEATAGVGQTEKANRKTKPLDHSRQSLKNRTAEEGVEKPKKKKRGRPSLNQEDAEPVEKQKPKRRREKQPAAEEEEEAEAEPESAAEEQPQAQGNARRSNQALSKQKRRRLISEEEHGSRSPSPETAPYRHLTSRTRRITRHTIQEKWSPLNPTSVDSVANLLHSATRPVLIRLNNLTKHAQATAALNAISNRLRSKLRRGLPFPPATTAHRREDELDYEGVVDGTQSLEAQLDPLLHSVALLQKERERAGKELEREYKVLNMLDANARSEIGSRREQLRKVHALVPDRTHEENDTESRRLGHLRSTEKGVGKTFSNLEDEDLKALTGQLGNHMESMRGNLQQIEGVTPAIAESRAALRLALLPHLGQQAFDHVLFG